MMFAVSLPLVLLFVLAVFIAIAALIGLGYMIGRRIGRRQAFRRMAAFCKETLKHLDEDDLSDFLSKE